MVNGESLFSYKARTEKTTPPASKPHRSKSAVNTQNAAKAKGPKPLTKAEQWLKDNPPNRQGIVDEVKSMLSPKNLTGANAIQAAIKGDGMSTTERITTGLTGVVQGLSFAVGGKAGKPAVEGIKNTGVPARIANKVKGETVVVHGTGRPIVGNTINPRAGSAYSPTEPAAFAWDTRFAEGKTGGQDWIHGNVQEYSNRPYYDPKLGKEVSGQGNIVIGKTKMKDAIKDLTGDGVIASKKPIKITKVIKEEPIGGKIYEQREKFIQELKRAGVKTKSGPVKSMLDKAEAAKLAKRQRKANKNSPV
jgi:hypothetical protein